MARRSVRYDAQMPDGAPAASIADIIDRSRIGAFHWRIYLLCSH